VTKANQKKALYAITVAVLLVIAYYLRAINIYIPNAVPRTLVVMLRGIIQISLIIAWCISLKTRIINRQVRRYLMAVAILLAFWLTVRTCKWEFVVYVTEPLGRWCWYAYYIPMIFVPLMGFFIADYIGKSEEYQMPKWMNCLYIPASLLLAGIFTNDLHQLAFSFPNGLEAYEKDYNHRIIYFITMAWFVLLGLYFVFTLLKKSRVPGSKSFQKLPAIIMVCAVIFWILYCFKLISCDLTVVDCLIITLLLESAIQSGLIPSNSNYEELFRQSTVAARIVDQSYQTCYVSSTAKEYSKEVMRSAETAPVHLGDTILNSKAITGGRILWQDEISHLSYLMEQLQDTQKQLGKDNELLKAELELKEQRAKTDEQNRLYDRIARDVSPQLTKVEGLLTLAEQDPTQSRKAIEKVAVICAFIKRRGNLLLLGEENSTVPSRELEYCLRESLDNLRLSGVFVSYESTCVGELSLKNAVAVYDLFEAVAEELLEHMTAVFISLNCEAGNTQMKLQIGCSAPITEQMLPPLPFPGGELKRRIQEEDLTIDLILPKGGATK